MADFPGENSTKKCSRFRGASLTSQVWIAALLLNLVAFVAIAFYLRGSSAKLFRDTFTLARVPIYFGLFSNLGVFCWGAAAIICLFSAAIILSLRRSRLADFLLASGLIALWLSIDDFFMLHEYIIPTKLGVAEEIVYVIYGIAAALYFFKFRSVIFRTHFTLLSVSLIFLAASLLIDKIYDYLPLPSQVIIEQQYLIEDGLKFLGIISWLFYFIETSFKAVNSHAASAIQETSQGSRLRR